MSYEPKVYRENGGDQLTAAAAGIILVKDDAYIKFGDDSDIAIHFDGTDLIITGLPTSDPGTEGALYNSSGTLKISAGGGGS